MLAMRIKQKDGTFYLVNFKAKDILSKVRFLTRVYNDEPIQTRVRDTDIARFIASVEKSDKEFQRALRERKIADIVSFFENTDQQPLIPSPVLLFTHEELEFSPIGEFTTQGNLSYPKDENFIIIDGQHRLAGLKVFCDRHPEMADSIEVPAIIFDKRQEDFAAEMFVIINSTQTRINKSHLIDLLDKVTTNASEEKKWAAWIVKCLYEDVRSPLRYKINMLGGRSQQEKWILQSELFNEIYRLVDKKTKENQPSVIHRFIAQEFGWHRRGKAPDIFIDYFQAVKSVMNNIWGNNEKYMFTTSVTIKALLRVLGKLLLDAKIRRDWMDNPSPQVFLDKISSWAELAEEFRREGFYERFAAKGQVERVGRIAGVLEKKIKV